VILDLDVLVASLGGVVAYLVVTRPRKTRRPRKRVI
jgi:hypothetical protein